MTQKSRKRQKSYQCEECTEHFDSQKSLAIHENIHLIFKDSQKNIHPITKVSLKQNGVIQKSKNKPNTYQCKECDEEFDPQMSLKNMKKIIYQLKNLKKNG